MEDCLPTDEFRAWTPECGGLAMKANEEECKDEIVDLPS